MQVSSTSDALAQRTHAFQQGISGASKISSLDAISANQNAMTPKGFDPGSILTAYMQPGFHPQNGNSQFDSSRQTPSGQISSPNAMSMKNWEARNPSTYRTRLAIQ